MLSLDVHGAVYADKVRGCWVGKNAGGTLGTPLEKAYGEEEPFDVWWYPELREGGLPNDDLEIQLIWLKALEEVGPALTATDLAQYWLDHVGYNFDEYGLSKTNLRLGLSPPVSGHFNNWFIDCMGSPIRSEIWACVAPGLPRIAARYAYEDAICDHAGGESVYGELFNVAVQSAGFVIDDALRLVDIGLSYVPADSQTAKAVRAAVDAHAAGVDWQEARRRVLAATPHYVAQYSPINLGFQVIGLLYGTDFASGICITVNCGYDTDSSGASIGSYLGILAGAGGLPAKWTEPLGESISTNESWGGVRHLSDGPNPAPNNLDDLVARIRAAAERVLTAHGCLGADGAVTVAEADLYADDDVRRRRDANPLRAIGTGSVAGVTIEYDGTPGVVPGSSTRVVTRLANRHPDPIEATVRLRGPDGFDAPPPVTVTLPPGDTALDWIIGVPGRALLDDSNRLFVEVSAPGRPAQAATPLVLIGAGAWRVAGPFPLDADREAARPDGDGDGWRDLAVIGNAVPLDGVLTAPGVLHLQTFLRSPDRRDVYLMLDSSCPNTVWLNRRQVGRRPDSRPIRPSYGGSDIETTLEPGWNELLVTLATDRDGPPDCHLLISSRDVFRNGGYDVGRTRFPWDED
ncbi:MAG: ADP-ribosylglycohydrolase family protein [Mycobacteriales bacterium]